MRSFSLRLGSVLLTFLLVIASAEAQITIRLSVKAVLNPATGMRQPGVSDLTFSNTVVGMNTMLDSFGRGYRFQWLGNSLINVGGLNQYNSGPSKYYDVDFHADESQQSQMEADALADTAAFAWNSSAINIYIVRYGGANWNVCSFPGDGSIILINGAAGYASAPTVIHEIGHFFNLSHTMNGEKFLNSDNSICTNGCSCAKFVGGGSDGVSDTILDHECWTSQDDIAQGNYGMNYAALSASQKTATDRIWFNLMSYHIRQHNVNLFTSDQLDRWSDAANYSRFSQVTGRTRFVDRLCSPSNPEGSSICSAVIGPFHTVAGGVNGASGGDIILIRPGHYNETMTVNKAVTFRATRGDAIVGVP